MRLFYVFKSNQKRKFVAPIFFMRQIYVLVFLFVPSFLFGQSQEIATFVQYNVLNYRNYTSFCSTVNNPGPAKEEYMKTIFSYLEPDVVILNEVVNNPAHAVKVVDRCLNVDGETKYMMASFAGSSNSSIANALYYNSDMFGVKNVDRITNNLSGGTLVRLIDVFTLYYKHANLPLGADTTFVTVFAAHLKAGSTSSDKSQRAAATEALMDYIETNNITGNYIMAGDFNVQSSSEVSFQNMIAPTNASIAFEDPINRLGDWNNEFQFADVHTQSTRTSTTSNGCTSGGGLDDRYDFLLISEDAKDGNDNMKAIKTSYWAVANDGNHFNESINFPANTSVPAAVLDAIYENSDHLPVRLDFIMTPTEPNSVGSLNPNPIKLYAVSEMGTTQLHVEAVHGTYQIEIISISGQQLFVTKQTVNQNAVIPVSTRYRGMALVSITDANGMKINKKIVIQ
jgi:hypothetical protein